MHHVTERGTVTALLCTESVTARKPTGIVKRLLPLETRTVAFHRGFLSYHPRVPVAHVVIKPGLLDAPLRSSWPG